VALQRVGCVARSTFTVCVRSDVPLSLRVHAVVCHRWRHFSKTLGVDPSPPISSPPSPLRSRLPKFPARGLGERCSSPSEVWGGTPAEIEFGAFWPSNLTSGGNNFNDFPENQLTKFRAEPVHRVLVAVVTIFQVTSQLRFT